jgi:hypothetical protein
MVIGVLGSIAYSIYAHVMKKKGKPYLKCWFPVCKEADGYIYPETKKEPEPFYDDKFKEWCIDESVANVTNAYWGKTKEDVLNLYYEHEHNTKQI